ncbi:hypothetical protein [Streptomyces olivaceoviridis]|uniref:hypothetical protein n=1 Tax=Streptomyces olivaceoviridis TaxID=1921 RepID=UPI0036B56923
MDQKRIARRAGLFFLRGLNDLARNLPHPDGPAIRITAVVIGTGEDLGSVDLDTTNAQDLGFLASRRTPRPRTAPALVTPTGKRGLYLVGGER